MLPWRAMASFVAEKIWLISLFLVYLCFFRGVISSCVLLNVNVVFLNWNVLRTCESCRGPIESFHSLVCSGPLVALYITVNDYIRYGVHEIGGLSALLRWHVMWERAVHSTIVQQSSSEKPTQTLWFSHVIGALWEREACYMENCFGFWKRDTHTLLYIIISSSPRFFFLAACLCLCTLLYMWWDLTKTLSAVTLLCQ